MSAVVAIETLLAARTLWHAGRSAAIAADGEPTGHAALDALLPQDGWPRRALTELLLPADGVGELSLLLPTLARCTQDGARVVLVAPPYLPYAPAWQAAGVDLSQLRIIDASPRDALWAFEQCLRSGACAVVLGWPQQADARALRRLQVAADSGQCLGFALRDRKHAANPSPAALRLEAVCTGRAIAWQVRKCRGGPVPASPFVLEPGAVDLAPRSGIPAAPPPLPVPATSAAPARRLPALNAMPAARVSCLREAREASAPAGTGAVPRPGPRQAALPGEVDAGRVAIAPSGPGRVAAGGAAGVPPRQEDIGDAAHSTALEAAAGYRDAALRALPPPPGQELCARQQELQLFPPLAPLARD